MTKPELEAKIAKIKKNPLLSEANKKDAIDKIEKEIEEMEPKKPKKIKEDNRKGRTLTSGGADFLIGKKIKWTAPAYEGNSTYKGVAIIESVKQKERRPITSKTISGDKLDYAFHEFDQKDEDDPLAYSDGGRYITYEIIGSAKPKKIKVKIMGNTEDYNCDELIEREKERKAKSKASTKKSEKIPEVTKEENKIEKVGKSVAKKYKEGELTKSQIKKLITELHMQIKELENLLKSAK